MRYVEYPPPLPDRTVETDVPAAITAIRPVGRVVPRTLPPLLLQPRRAALRTMPEETPVQHGERRVHVEEERRKLCRRVNQATVTLDTRSGHDRRHEARREDDHLEASVDIKA